jgi:hypothetical protein
MGSRSPARTRRAGQPAFHWRREDGLPVREGAAPCPTRTPAKLDFTDVRRGEKKSFHVEIFRVATIATHQGMPLASLLPVSFGVTPVEHDEAAIEGVT